jgi:ankyrin repeat protein
MEQLKFRVKIILIFLIVISFSSCQSGNERLFSYVEENDFESLKELLNEKPILNLNVLNNDKQTPLYLAVQNKNYQIAELLLNNGAKPDTLLPSSLLNLALKNEDFQMINLLIANKADVNRKDSLGNRPIFYTNKKELYKLLLSHGADNTVINSQGVSFKDYIINKNFDEINTYINSKIKFNVCNVPKAKNKLIEMEYSKLLEEKLECKVEAFDNSRKSLVFSPNNSFVSTIALAYKDHRPVSFSPDMIWLLICQGVSKHIELNSEKLRNKIVKHEGKVSISIRRDSFVKGNSENNWKDAFPEICSKIQSYLIDSLQNLIVPTFSTTTIVERNAFQITFMNSVSKYFDYGVVTICGIPEITLEGTPEDWEWILNNVDSFRKYDLDWWVDKLKPVLKEFTNASKGKLNKYFWQNIYNSENLDCGGQFVTGWIINFFPYIENQPNKFLNIAYNSQTGYGGLTNKSFPNGLASVDFEWDYFDKKYEMQLISGFVGTSQDSTNLTLRPEIGWWIIDRIKEKR